MRKSRVRHRGTVWVLVSALLLSTSFPAAAESNVASCPVTLERLTQQVLQSARATYGVSPETAETALRDRAVREENVRAAVDAVDRQLATLNEAARELEADPVAEVDACAGETTCERKVAVKFHRKFAAVVAAVTHTLFGNGAARRRVEEKYRELAKIRVADYLATLRAEERQPSAAEARALADRVAKAALEKSRQPATIKGFLGIVLKPFANAFAAVTFRELRRPGSDFESGVNEARRDFLFNYGIVTLLQVAAHGLKMFSDFRAGDPVHFWDMLWVYGNTFVMMSLQAEVGARNQRALDAKVQIRTFEDAVRALPGILHGERGYFKDSLAKFLGFLLLVPYELFSNVLLRAANGVALGGTAAMGGGKLIKITLQNMYATCAFGIYLAVRWALLDKWFNLNLLPAWRNGKMLEMQEAYAELEAKGLPTVLSARDLYRHVKPWYRRPFGAAWDVVKSPFAALGNWWGGSRTPEEKAELAEAKRVADRLRDTPEMRRFLAAYKGTIFPRAVEGVWRVGSGLFDSFLFFTLFTEKKGEKVTEGTEPVASP